MNLEMFASVCVIVGALVLVGGTIAIAVAGFYHVIVCLGVL